jgi:hypothetical protein
LAKYTSARQVLGLEGVHARLEHVGDLALVDEDRDLALAHGKPGAHLDLVVVAGEAPHDGVAAVVGPLDDVDELALDLVDEPHGRVLPGIPCGHGSGHPSRHERGPGAL